MIGLIYKDITTILHKFKFINRIILVIVSLLVVIFLHESGTILLSMLLPIGLASIPGSLLVYDEQSGWDKYVALFPISKSSIVVSRYIFCLSVTFCVSLACIFLNSITSLIFNEFTFEIHMIISLVGLSVAVIYMVLLLPSIYAYGTIGSTIVNIIMLSGVMIFIYVTQHTPFGDFFIDILSNVDKIIIIIFAVSVIVILTVLSLILSIKIYSKSFRK